MISFLHFIKGVPASVEAVVVRVAASFTWALHVVDALLRVLLIAIIIISGHSSVGGR